MHIAGINQGAPAPIVPLPPFNPAEWLARYVELGGGYAVIGDAVWLHWSLNGDVDELALKAHEMTVRRDGARHAAVKALIMERVSKEAIDD